MSLKMISCEKMPDAVWHVIEKRVQACTMYVRQCRTNDRIGKSVQNGCEEQLQSIDHILQISQSELSDSRVGGVESVEREKEGVPVDASRLHARLYIGAISTNLARRRQQRQRQ
uniref:Uncharacterized protein n=1 Tax=Anopheles coluzzii TaxID=1518534 RepID=A0A8W7PTC0_ANOCL